MMTRADELRYSYRKFWEEYGHLPARDRRKMLPEELAGGLLENSKGVVHVAFNEAVKQLASYSDVATQTYGPMAKSELVKAYREAIKLLVDIL